MNFVKKNKKALGVAVSALFTVFITWYGSSYLPNQIAKIEGQNDFVEKFSLFNHTRVFWAEKYFRNVEDRESKVAIDNAWNKYMDSVNDWNSYNVYNPVFIHYYFGVDFKSEFEAVLPPAFINLHQHLLELKQNGTTSANLSQEIEWAKNRTFYFSEKMLGIQE